MNYEEFIEYLERTPYVGNQEQCGTGKDYWNADLWTLEVARCLYWGKYYSIPEEFKDNKNCDPNRIKKDAQVKLSLKKSLEKIKDKANVLLIGEVGRGLDILVSNMVKKWDMIYCWDQVDYTESLSVFDNIFFIHKSSSAMIHPVMKEKHIFIMNHSIHQPSMFLNNNLVHSIIDGEILW